MSKIEVNTVEPQCGTTLTLGASGDTVTLGCGASQSGFGRTGTVDWVTTVQTSTITAVNGKGYFVNTTGGAITANLPAGSAGSIVAFKDYAATFDSNSLIISPNGSEKIGGTAGNAVLTTESQSVTLVYIDSTQGWLDIHDSTSSVAAAQYVTATVSGSGNTLSTSGDYKIARFTGPGTFCVSQAGNSTGSNTVDYLVVAGGGAGNTKNARNPNTPDRYAQGGGGAGGLKASSGTASGCYTAGPTPLTSPVSALPVSVQGYPITVGGGGSAPAVPGTCTQGNSGSNSTFSTVTAHGGGGGGYGSPCTYSTAGANGGSGGGGGAGPPSEAGGTGNTPPSTPPQGNDGGSGTSVASTAAGGGGGATVVGTNGTGNPSAPSAAGGAGGAGLTSCITASPVAYAGGGGGGAGYYGSSGTVTAGAGGSGGGGAGGNPSPSNGTSGTAATGGGGGGAGGNGSCGTCTGGNGGGGVVIIRYKFQN
jgi:hypothetical protein